MAKICTWYKFVKSDIYMLYVVISDPKLNSAHGFIIDLNSKANVDYAYSINCDEKKITEEKPNISKKQLRRCIKQIFKLHTL